MRKTFSGCFYIYRGSIQRIYGIQSEADNIGLVVAVKQAC